MTETKPRTYFALIEFFLLTLGLLLLAGCSASIEPVAGTLDNDALASPTGTQFDINNCAAAQGVTRRADQLLDNRALCYQARAEQLNDWTSCLELSPESSSAPAQCLVGVTLRSQAYVCAKGNNAAIGRMCNELLMVAAGTDPKLHELEGLHERRITRVATLNVGDSFNVDGVGVVVGSDGLVILPDYYPATSHVCHPQENPPLAVGTGIQGAYLYVTGCTVTETGLTVNYFRYDLPGLNYPAHL